MFCRVCILAEQCGTTVKRWIDGFDTLSENKIKSHAESKLHQDSVEKMVLRMRNKSSKVILEPVNSIKRTDLLTALQAMYDILKRKPAFSNYEDQMSFLSLLGVTTPVAELPKNANLRSELNL